MTETREVFMTSKENGNVEAIIEREIVSTKSNKVEVKIYSDLGKFVGSLNIGICGDLKIFLETDNNPYFIIYDTIVDQKEKILALPKDKVNLIEFNLD